MPKTGEPLSLALMCRKALTIVPAMYFALTHTAILKIFLCEIHSALPFWTNLKQILRIITTSYQAPAMHQRVVHLVLSSLHFLKSIFIYICEWCLPSTSTHMRGDEKTTGKSQISSSTMWVLVMELKLAGLATSILTHCCLASLIYVSLFSQIPLKSGTYSLLRDVETKSERKLDS